MEVAAATSESHPLFSITVSVNPLLSVSWRSDRLLQHVQSERALICTFLALLELVRLQAILLRQSSSFSEIYIKKHDNFESALMEGRDDWR